MIRNYVLVEPTLGETVHQPGALMRSVRDGDGFRIELLTGPGQWEDRTALLAPYVMNGEPGAEVIGPVQAQLLERNYPWPHARTFPPSLRFNPNHGSDGKFAAGAGGAAKAALAKAQAKQAMKAWVGGSPDSFRKALLAHDMNTRQPLDQYQRALLNELNNAPRSTIPLYRGQSLPRENYEQQFSHPGFQFDMSATGFSSEPLIAQGFRGSSMADRIGVEFHLEPGAHALPVDYSIPGADAYENEAEHIVRGTFRVESVDPPMSGIDRDGNPGGRTHAIIHIKAV